MTLFRKMLVGVDLSYGDWMADTVNLTPSNLACRRAVDIAKATGASLHFLAALDLDARTQRILKEAPETERNVLAEADQELRQVAQRAIDQGIDATYSVELGRSWKRIIERTRQEQHDLVLLGSQRPTAFGALLLGSTGMHVLGAAEAPVWIARPRDGILSKIMVATDFSPVCDELLLRAAELASIFATELHILHVLEPKGQGFWRFGRPSPERLQQGVADARQEAEQKLAQRQARVAVGLPSPPQIHLREGRVEEIVLEMVATHRIDLLVMGLVAWGGIQGLLMGSTAQSLFPRLECSLLTMRGKSLS